ncbi:hypothetical protein FRC03_007822 [Tulasnella sp. 419]|nr:hypothetical protein FRC03_007822 [Tulasnella sp. 419]
MFMRRTPGVRKSTRVRSTPLHSAGFLYNFDICLRTYVALQTRRWILDWSVLYNTAPSTLVSTAQLPVQLRRFILNPAHIFSIFAADSFSATSSKKKKKTKTPIVNPAEKQYANGHLLRSTIADKEKAVRFQLENETKAQKEARERGEAQKASRDAATKLNNRQIPIDAPGQPISATQKQYNLRNRALPPHDPSRYVFGGPPNTALPPLTPSTPPLTSPQPVHTLSADQESNLQPAQSSIAPPSPILPHVSVPSPQVDDDDDEDEDEDEDEEGEGEGVRLEGDRFGDDSSARLADEGDDEPEPEFISALRPKLDGRSIRAPIRIQMFDFDAYKKDPWLSEHVTAYVNTDQLVLDEKGNVSCHLSDILPKAAQFNSPLKDRNYKIWRLDSRKQPVSLGRGDAASSSVAEQHTLDLHQLQLHEASDDDGTDYYSGVKLLLEDKPKSATRRQALQFFLQSPLKSQSRAESPTSPSPVKVKETRPKSNVSSRSKGNSSKAPKQQPHKAVDSSSDNDDSDSEVETNTCEAKVKWLRKYFELPAKENRLPGRIQVVKARAHLDRWKLITRAKGLWEGEWQKLVPDDVEGIGGQRLKLEHLQAAFGFAHSNWHQSLKTFKPTMSPLMDAPHVLAWMENPDSSRYTTLNSVSMKRLKDIIQDDSKGRFSPGSGESAKSSHQSKDNHHRNNGKKRKLPAHTRSRSRSRSRSPTRQRRYSPARSSSSRDQDIHSDDMD